jgi:thioredoxin 1
MGHAADSQRLIFTGRVLDNSQPLSAYNIKSNCTLHLVVSKSLGAAKSPTKEGGGLGPPAGLVHGITGGAIELRQVLINAGPRLVVVDWMAPWCGPCRAIAPKIDDLASNNADVVFLKIDTEASGENKALAMDAQIQAFPTFHFYINSNRVAQVVSADLNKIVTTMNQHKPNILSEAAAALGEADPAAADALVQKVKAALVKLKASCSSDQDFIAATKTYLSFIGNCVNNPTEAKYRRIRQGNPSFQSRLGSKVGGIEALKAFGFNEVSEGVPPEDYLILDSVLPEMVQVKELLEKAVPGGSAAAAAPASSLSSLSPAGGLGGLGGLPGMMGAMGAGGMGGLGGVGGPGGMANIENAMRMMENPAIRQMTENLMRNPRMMQVCCAISGPLLCLLLSLFRLSPTSGFVWGLSGKRNESSFFQTCKNERERERERGRD